MSQQKALLAGSSFSALPILLALKNFGVSVTVAGNLPDDPCHGHGDASLHFNYTDKHALLAAAKDSKFDFVVPSCNDESYLACAYVAQELGLPGYDNLDNADFINTKSLYRPFLEQHSFPVPRAARNGDYDALKFPVLVKPVDASGGKGLTKVMRAADLPAALDAAQKASKTGAVIVEEFFDGTLHSHSAFIAGGKIHADFFADEFCTIYPYQVNCSNHPSRLSDGVRAVMRREMTRLCGLRKLNDGLLHTQFMTNGQDVRIIESMRRCPGDLYGCMIEYSTGFDHAAHFVAPFVGRPYPAAKNLSEKPVGRHTISVLEPMMANDISVAFPASSIRFLPLKTAGQRLDPTPFDKFGLLFIDYVDEREMLEKTSKLADFVTINGQKV